MNPNNLMERWSRLAGGWLSAACIAGCAFAPGFQQVFPEPQPALTNPPPGVSVDLRPIEPGVLAQLSGERNHRAQTLAPLLRGSTDPTPYRIGVGDVLGITVWGHAELNLPPAVIAGNTADTSSIPPGFSVGQNGEIQFAYAGKLKVQGLTESEATDLLARALAPYLRNPQITLRVQAYRSQKVYVEGEVRNPGQQVINDLPMTLAEALGRSGGVTPQADRSRVVLVRQGQRHDIDLTALVQSGLTPSNLMLRDGDLIRVSPRDESRVSVMGEVVRPGVVVTRNGRLSLQEALAESGGLQLTTANARQIYVLRGIDTERVEVYHLDAQSSVMLSLAERFDLQPRDIVYVDAAPLALWNRVVTLLVPSFGAAQTTNNTLNNR